MDDDAKRYVNDDYECTKRRLVAFNPNERLEIIGNIHDNSELLKGGDLSV